MTKQSEPSGDRIAIAVDRGTRIALVCLTLWAVSGMAARADEDPRAAASAIGMFCT